MTNKLDVAQCSCGNKEWMYSSIDDIAKCDRCDKCKTGPNGVKPEKHKIIVEEKKYKFMGDDAIDCVVSSCELCYSINSVTRVEDEEEG